MVLYVLVSTVAIGLAGAPVFASSGSPLTASGVTGSTGAVLLISFGGMIATASVLLTTILGISRILFAMARNGDFPPVVSRISRFNTPHYAIVSSGAAMIAAVLLADLKLVVAVGTFAMLIYYLIANLAALRLSPKRRRYPVAVSGIGAATCVGLVVFLTVNAWIISIFGLATEIVIYRLREWTQK